MGRFVVFDGAPTAGTDGQGRAVQHSSGAGGAGTLEGASGSGEQVGAVFV